MKVDPLFSSEAGLNPMSEAWQSRMKEVGLDPNGGGPSTIESPGFESARRRPLSELEVASDATLMHVQQRDSADGRV